MEIMLPGGDAQGLFQVVGRLLPVLLPSSRDSQVHHGLPEAGIDLQGLLIVLASLGDATLLLDDQPQIAPGVRLSRVDLDNLP